MRLGDKGPVGLQHHHYWVAQFSVVLSMYDGYEITDQCASCGVYRQRRVSLSSVYRLHKGAIDSRSILKTFPPPQEDVTAPTHPEPHPLSNALARVTGSHKPSAACACESCRQRSAELDAALNEYRDTPLKPL